MLQDQTLEQAAAVIHVPFVDLRAQLAGIREEIDAAVRCILDAGAFVLGAQLGQFEREFASSLGVRYVAGVANGTDALLLTLRALGIGPGDEVIVPANTFVATVEAVVHAGARPVLVDVDPRTYNIDVGEVEAHATAKLRAIIPVHMYGQPADLGPIVAFAEQHGCRVIEDAAQAHGAEYKGRKVGSVGLAGCFSFYPAKNLGAYGDAGAVVTNDDELALAVRSLRHHGGIEKYRHDVVGYNSRMDTLQAGILLVKLKHLDEWNEKRRRHARLYDELLSGIPGIVTPATSKESRHVYHLYVIRIERGSRGQLRERLRQHGIETGIHYPAPVHLTGAFRYLGYEKGAFPVAEQCADQVLSLPMYPELETAQIQFVAKQISDHMTACA